MKIRSLSLGPVFFVLTVGVAPCMGEVNEVDNNFDGKIDTWQYVNAQGKIEKAEYDEDFDGKVDRVDHFKGEKTLERVEFDKNKK